MEPAGDGASVVVATDDLSSSSSSESKSSSGGRLSSVEAAHVDGMTVDEMIDAVTVPKPSFVATFDVVVGVAVGTDTVEFVVLTIVGAGNVVTVGKDVVTAAGVVEETDFTRA